MPKRNRFVRAEKVTIQLVDVQKHLHQELVTKGVLIDEGEKKGEYRAATQEEISAAFTRVQQASDDGDWIAVKKELTAGEQRGMFITTIKDKALHQGERPVLDPEKVGVAKILTYLLGWSFLDDEGEPMPYNAITMCEDERLVTILRLSGDDYAEVEAAIDYHIERVGAEREARKNVPAGEMPSSPISPSPVA